MTGVWLHRSGATDLLGGGHVHLLSGPSLPKVVVVLSLRLVSLGSVHCRCCLCSVVDTCQFPSGLDECHSGMGPGLLILR